MNTPAKSRAMTATRPRQRMWVSPYAARLPRVAEAIVAGIAKSALLASA
jgi:hypothetical protein